MPHLKILLVDDEPHARKKLRSFLEQEDEISQIVEADNGQQAVEQIRKFVPDLVFLDIQMPG